MEPWATIGGFIVSIVIVNLLSAHLIERGPRFTMFIRTVGWCIIGGWAVLALMAVADIFLRRSKA